VRGIKGRRRRRGVPGLFDEAVGRADLGRVPNPDLYKRLALQPPAHGASRRGPRWYEAVLRDDPNDAEARGAPRGPARAGDPISAGRIPAPACAAIIVGVAARACRVVPVCPASPTVQRPRHVRRSRHDFRQGRDGGNGVVSFRKEKYVPRGGPNGGDGGDGGQVLLAAVDGLTNLAHLSSQRHFLAEKGEHGQGSDCTGRRGKDLVIEVPVGTIVRDRDRGHVLRDMKEPGEWVAAARGGAEGHGNAFFKSPPTAPPGRPRRGGLGEERWISLELKVHRRRRARRPAHAASPRYCRGSPGPPRDRRLPVHHEYPNLARSTPAMGTADSSWPTSPAGS
jgi:hypothetical protein